MDLLESQLMAGMPTAGGPSQTGTVAPEDDVAPAPTPAANVQGEGISRVSPQAISVPSGTGTAGGMGESFTAQLTTGISTFNIPIQVPSGRVGMSPSVGLSYASASGYGVAGVGWGLAASMAISRQTDRGTPGYDDRDDWHPGQDRFIFGGQELVPICRVEGGACLGALAAEVMPIWGDGWQYFRARVEGSFMRFFWSPDHQTWRIQTKSGMNFELGIPLDGTNYQEAVERNPTNTQEIYRWMLVRQYDAHGAPNASPPAPVNLIQYRYFQDGNVAHLSDIYYTTPAADPGTTDLSTYAHHVSFEYEQRPDPSLTYRPGWLLHQRVRLTRIDVASKLFENPMASPRQMVRRYHLEYDTASHASLLEHVSMEGRCFSPTFEESGWLPPETNCPRLPAVTLEYQRVAGTSDIAIDEYGLNFEPFGEEIRQVEEDPLYTLGSSQSLSALMDVNQDGLPDMVVTNPTEFDGNHGVYFNLGEIDGTLQFSEPEEMYVTGVSNVDASVLRLSNPNVSVLDLDGNAAVDLVHMPTANRYEIFSPRFEGGSWEWHGHEVNTASGNDVKIDFTRNARRTAVMDVNGDGLVDVVFASATEYQTFLALGRYPGGAGQFGSAQWTGPESADISNDPVTACTPWSATAARLGDADVRVADLNGDGLPDIARVRDGQILFWPGRGNGYWGTGERNGCASGEHAQNAHVTMANAPEYGVTGPGDLQFADVNGDGFADLVEIRREAVDIYLNRSGNGFSDRVALTEVPVQNTGTSAVRLVDINGSGTVDLVWGHGREFQYIDLTQGKVPHVLTRVHNGLGQTTELEYRSSVELMVEARESGRAWSSKMPMATAVLVSSTVRDNLEKVGLPRGAYATQYSYQDPVFVGLQREFRGFRTATTRELGDVHDPTLLVRSTHLLGECHDAQNGVDTCSAQERWRDNWREALKGRVSVTETFDEYGVYLETTHTRYELRQIYKGRDGRRVSMAMATIQDTFKYDTTDFDGISSQTSTESVVANLDGIALVETTVVPKRAAAGTVQIRSETEHDDFGNSPVSVGRGCVSGCSQSDEEISNYRTTQLIPGDTSGWLWRPTQSHIVGNIQSQPRSQRRTEYDIHGDLVEAFATLSGTLLLDRFHESGAAIAPPPAEASGGVSAPVEISIATQVRDVFGNLVELRGAKGGCGRAVFDDDYAELSPQEMSYAGTVGPDGCGETEFITTAVFDRGQEQVLSTVSKTGQPAAFQYDGFGRLLSKTFVDPQLPGTLAQAPSVVYEYLITNDDTTQPYSLVIVRTIDGDSVNDSSYRTRYHYADGLGRRLAVLSEADPGEGDGGEWVVASRGDYTAKGTPYRSYEHYFWHGNPLEFSFGGRPSLRDATEYYDAFGRTTSLYGLDGEQLSATVFHTLSVETWDAADLSPGPHANTPSVVLSDGHGRQRAVVERLRVNGSIQSRTTSRTYLPTGEVTSVRYSEQGQPDLVRWSRYDSLGRLVLNVEPNTAVSFSDDPDSDPDSIKAWRYAYDDAGELVGTSDPRGCGVNYFRDAASRLVYEDISPCLGHHDEYTAPDLEARTGIEVYVRYDVEDPEASSVVDAAGRAFPTNSTLLAGRIASISDRGSKTVLSYDFRGQVVALAKRLAKPGPSASALADRYAPRWYLKESAFDGAGRPTTISTGATSSELLDSAGQSFVEISYTSRGGVQEVTSSYGQLLARENHDANGVLQEIEFGDAASTTRSYSYNDKNQIRSVQTYRTPAVLWESPTYSAQAESEPTQQLLLEDFDFERDSVGNITEVTDWRIPEEWPEGAKPTTKKYEYDDKYRLTRATYAGAVGADVWFSPFAAENEDGQTVDGEPRPMPHGDFAERTKEETYAYDRLGNIRESSDDTRAFWDRSTGRRVHGGIHSGPQRLLTASNRSLGAPSSRHGDLEIKHNPGGNISEVVVRRDGSCLPLGASCWQRFHYEWDELGNLSRARRWDLAEMGPDERTAHGELSNSLPTRAPDVELNYRYSGNSRVLKTARDPSGAEVHDAYIFSSLELRRTTFEANDFLLTPTSERVTLEAGGVTARLLFSVEDLPEQVSGNLHLFLVLRDHLGSASSIIDHGTGELVEHATYSAYGAADTSYRPERWSGHREVQRFTGKEEDVEVGLIYFGARYYSPNLGIWMSPDPVAVHRPGVQANPYAYVEGRPTMATDPDGRWFALVQLGATLATNFAVFGAPNAASQASAVGLSNVDWGLSGVAGVYIAGNVAGLATLGLGSAMIGAGGVVTGGILGQVGAGAASGVLGAGVNYGTYHALNAGNNDVRASWGDFGKAIAIGAASGAGGGFLGGVGHYVSGIRGLTGNAVGNVLGSTGTRVGLSAALNDGRVDWSGSVYSASVSLASGLAQSSNAPTRMRSAGDARAEYSLVSPEKTQAVGDMMRGYIDIETVDVLVAPQSEMPLGIGWTDWNDYAYIGYAQGTEVVVLSERVVNNPNGEFTFNRLLAHELTHVVQEREGWGTYAAHTAMRNPFADPYGRGPVEASGATMSELGASGFLDYRFTTEGIADYVGNVVAIEIKAAQNAGGP